MPMAWLRSGIAGERRQREAAGLQAGASRCCGQSWSPGRCLSGAAGVSEAVGTPGALPAAGESDGMSALSCNDELHRPFLAGRRPAERQMQVLEFSPLDGVMGRAI